jgi:hypothetical protein
MLTVYDQHLQLSPAEIDAFYSLSLADFLKLPAIEQRLNKLNTALLRQTLPTASTVLAQQLPPFYDWLQNELGVKRVPDSPDHTTTWVMRFVNNHESLMRLVELHRPVPLKALEQAVPRLVAAFDHIKESDVCQEWQKAITLLCLVLVVAARSREKALR